MEKINPKNKTSEDISEMYYALKNSIKDYLFTKLEDTDKEHPMSVNIELDFGAVGLSSLNIPKVTNIYFDSKEEIIYVETDYLSDDYMELDEFSVEDQMSIVRQI